jgi:muramidase (phage lysozyme)
MKGAIMASVRKEVQRLVDEALGQGWEADDRGTRVMLFSPDGQSLVTLHWMPSDHRWRENAYRDLRRGGFIKRKGT